jgi:hypothetical protein
LRPDLRFDDIRGNVDTRLRKLRDGDYDAIILASAGMKRLDLRATYTVPFPVEVLVPAVAQGALAIEMRDGDPHAARIAAILDDPHTDLAVRAERAFLRTLRGGCQAPVGAHAEYDGTTLRLHAAIAAADGSTVMRESLTISPASVAEAEAAATALAQAMLHAGGEELLAPQTLRGALAGLVFVSGPVRDGTRAALGALRDEGAEIVEAADAHAAAAALAGRTPNAVLLTSPEAVRTITAWLADLRDDGARPLVIASDAATAAASAACGWPADAVAHAGDVASFVQTVTRTLLENAP